MKYKFNTYYIVTKGSDDNTIQKDDTLLLRYRKNTDKYSTLGEYTMFLPPRETQGNFFGMPPLNTTLYFNTRDELDAVMGAVEIEYNLKLAQELIDDKQKEIDRIRSNHGMNSHKIEIG